MQICLQFSGVSVLPVYIYIVTIRNTRTFYTDSTNDLHTMCRTNIDVLSGMWRRAFALQTLFVFAQQTLRRRIYQSRFAERFTHLILENEELIAQHQMYYTNTSTILSEEIAPEKLWVCVSMHHLNFKSNAHNLHLVFAQLWWISICFGIFRLFLSG